MDTDKRLELIRRKTRRRYVFALMTLAVYFTFVLNWTEAGAGLGNFLGDTHISGSLVLFAGLIILMIVFEIIFLALNRSGDEQ